MNRHKLFVIVLFFSALVVLPQAQYTLGSSLSELTPPRVLAMPSTCGGSFGAVPLEAAERLDHNGPAIPVERFFYLMALKGVAEHGVIVRTDALFDFAEIVECGCRRFWAQLTCCIYESKACVSLGEP